MKKYDEAVKVLKRMARINGVDFKGDLLEDWMASEKRLLDTKKSATKNESALRSICFPRVKFLKIFLLFVLWNSLSMNYVGVSLGITSVLKMNPYIIFSFSAVFELLGTTICHFNQK